MAEVVTHFGSSREVFDYKDSAERIVARTLGSTVGKP
jgi:hypothetical protein